MSGGTTEGMRGGAGRGNTAAELVRQANRWRDQYNPLRGLVISRVVAMLEAGERGEYADLQWTYRFVEKRYPVLRALIARRQAALMKLEWAVKPVEVGQWLERRAKQSKVPRSRPLPGGDGKDTVWEMADGRTYTAAQIAETAERQAAYLRQCYERISNLKEAIRALSLAEFRGFAMLAKLRRGPDGEARTAGPGEVTELHWLPQWNVVRDGMFGDYYWNPEARSVSALSGLQKIDLRRVLVRTVEMPIDEIGLVAYLRTNLSQKDWDAFIEIVGLPGGVVIMPPNIPPGKEDEYEAAATAVAEGGSGALPNGADIRFPTAGYRGQVPFKEHLEWQEKDVVLAGTGGKLTMLNEATGIGGSQGRVHQDAFDEIATMEAAEISEVFQKQFDAVELEAVFPGEPVLAYWQLQPMDETAQERLAFKREVFKAWMADGTVSDVLANQTDLKQLTRDVELPVNEEYVDPYLPVVHEGGVVTGEVVRDSEGDIIGSQVVQPRPGTVERGSMANRAAATTVANGDEGEAANEMDPVVRAVAMDLEPWRARLEAILRITDPGIMEAKLRALLEEVEQLKADIGADPAMAREIEGVIARGLVEGVEGVMRGARGEVLVNGDKPGHPFRGNQYTGATGADAIKEVLERRATEAVYGEVTPEVAAKIKEATGIDATGHKHLLELNGLVHIHKTHGVGFERQADHLPVTQEDILKLPEIVSSPDKIEDGGTTRRGLRAVKYIKHMSGGTTYFVEEHWTRERVLAAKSMWKKKGATGRSATPDGGVFQTS